MDLYTKLIEIEAEIATIENDILPDLHYQLANPNPDDIDYLEDDIEYLENEIATNEQRLKKLYAQHAKYNLATVEADRKTKLDWQNYLNKHRKTDQTGEYIEI